MQTGLICLFVVFCTLTTAFGQSGSVLHFDGTDDFIDIPASITADNESQTVEFYFKYSTLPLVNSPIVIRGDDNFGGWSIELQLRTDGKLGSYKCCMTAISHPVGNTTLSANTWYHLAMVHDASNGNTRVYINGSLEMTGLYNTNLDLRSSSVGYRFGRENMAYTYGGTTTGFINEYIDEIQIWNTARSASEISTDMGGYSGSYSSNLKFYAQLNEGTANANNTGISSTLVDATGNSSATMYNFAKTGNTSNWISPTFSTDANLSNFTLSSGTLSPSFSSGTISYTASVSSATSSVTVTPTAADGNATIQARVNGSSYTSVTSGNASSALSLNFGTNTIDVKVTAEDGSTIKTYTTTVTRSNYSANSNGDWNTASTWVGNAVPLSNSEVDINANVTINSGTITVNNLIINNGYSLTLASGASILVNGTTTLNGNGKLIVPTGAFLTQTVSGSPVTFPLVPNSGSSNIPLSISNGGGVSFSVGTSATGPFSGVNGNLSAYSAAKSVSRQFDITPSSQPGSATISFQFVASDLPAGVSPTSTKALFHYNGSGWDQVATATPTGSGPYNVSFNYSGSFSPFSFGNPPTTNADLDNLTLTSPSTTISPSFAAGTYSYQACISSALASISVTPTVASGYGGTVEYQLNGGGYSSTPDATPIILSLIAGTNTVDIKVTSQDATNTNTYTVTLYRNPTALFTLNDNTQCLTGNSIVMTDASSNGSGTINTWAWSVAGGTPNTFAVQGPNTTSYATSGNKTINLTVTDDNGCSNSTAYSNNVTIYAQPTASFTLNDNTQCLTGNSVVMTDASSNGSGTINTWAWSVAGGTPNTFAVQGPNTTSYATSGNKTINLTVTDDNGCSNSTAYSNNVTIYAQPTASFTLNDNTQCLTGNSVVMTDASSNGSGTINTWAWSVAGGSPNTFAVQGPNTTSYATSGNKTINLTVTDNNGCSNSTAYSNNVTIYAHPTAAFTLNDNTQCLTGNSVVMTDASSNGSGTINTWAWSVAGGTPNTFAVQGPNTTSYATSGNKTINLTVTDNNGCSNSTAYSNNVTIYAHPTAAFTLNDNTQCLTGNVVTMTNTSSNGSGSINSWAWSTVGGTNPSETGVGPHSTTYSTDGDYTINLTVTDNNGCANSTAYTNNVTIYQMPNAAAITGTNHVCAGGTQVLSSNVTLGTTPYSYSWATSNPSAVTLPNTNSSTQTVSGTLAGGVSNISYTVTDAHSCAVTSATYAETVVAVQPLAYTVAPDTIYTGQTGATFTVPSDPLADYYSWTFSGSGTTFNAPTNTNYITMDISIIAGTGNKTVSVYAHTNTPTCTSVARSKTIYVSDEIPWRGYIDTDWDNAGNWAENIMPTSITNVVITATTNEPTISGAGPYEVRRLKVNSGATLTIGSGKNLKVNNNYINNGKVEGDYLTLNGSGLQTLSGDGRTDKLELNNSNGATISSGDFGVKKFYLPTSGVLTTNGHLRLVSNALSTASVLAPPSCTGLYINGIVTCEKYIAGGRRAYRFLCHPFQEYTGLYMLTDDIDITGDGGPVNGFTPSGTNNPSAFFFNTWNASNDQTNDITGWVRFSTAMGTGNDRWFPGEGVRILVRGAKGEGLDGNPYTPSAATLTMPGNLNQCDTTYHLGANTNIGKDGYNLIGNPYACNIDLSTTTRGDSIGTCFWVWDPHLGLKGAYLNYPFSSSYILPAYSSFFATNIGKDTNSPYTHNFITFHETDKTIASSTDPLHKNTNSNDLVKMTLLSDNQTITWDQFLLYFDQNSIVLFDINDGEKIKNPNVDIFTMADTNKLSVDFRPLVLNQTIPVGIRSNVNNQFTFRVDDYNVNGTQLYFIDKYKNIVTPMNLGMTYTFDLDTLNSLSLGNNRFVIGIGTTSVAQFSGRSINMTVTPNPATNFATVSFDALKESQTTITVTNLLGQNVFTKDLGKTSTATIQIPVKEFTAGVYMVTVKCGFDEMTQKLIKQ